MASASRNDGGLICSTSNRFELCIARTHCGYSDGSSMPVCQWLKAKQTSKYKSRSSILWQPTNPRTYLHLSLLVERFAKSILTLTCRLLCSTNRPTSGLANDLVRNMTTHKSSCDRWDFSELRCPSWNNVNSASVGSNTVNKTQDNEQSGCSVPCRRTSFQPQRTLQISMQSKYLEKPIFFFM